MRPVCSSMLATVRLSGRTPERSGPASPPRSKMLKRPCAGPETVVAPKTVSMKSFCTATRWLAKSRPPDRPRHRTPLSPVMKSRCLWGSSSGCAIRQASTTRYAQPTAHSTSPPRTAARNRVSVKRPMIVCGAARAATSNPNTKMPAAPAQRTATLPRRRFPAASWALPGATTVISRSVTARRNRTRPAATDAPVRAADVGRLGGSTEDTRFSITSHTSYSTHDPPSTIGGLRTSGPSWRYHRVGRCAHLGGR